MCKHADTVLLFKIRLVRKQYVGEAHKAAFSREKHAYEALFAGRYRSPYFLDCYGYFSQTLPDGTVTYNLILEFARGGSLQKYYMNCTPPKNHKELTQFWTSLISPLEALHSAHRVSEELNDPATHTMYV